MWINEIKEADILAALDDSPKSTGEIMQQLGYYYETITDYSANWHLLRLWLESVADYENGYGWVKR